MHNCLRIRWRFRWEKRCKFILGVGCKQLHMVGGFVVEVLLAVTAHFHSVFERFLLPTYLQTISIFPCIYQIKPWEDARWEASLERHLQYSWNQSKFICNVNQIVNSQSACNNLLFSAIFHVWLWWYHYLPFLKIVSWKSCTHKFYKRTENIASLWFPKVPQQHGPP